MIPHSLKHCIPSDFQYVWHTHFHFYHQTQLYTISTFIKTLSSGKDGTQNTNPNKSFFKVFVRKRGTWKLKRVYYLRQVLCFHVHSLLSKEFGWKSQTLSHRDNRFIYHKDWMVVGRKKIWDCRNKIDIDCRKISKIVLPHPTKKIWDGRKKLKLIVEKSQKLCCHILQT